MSGRDQQAYDRGTSLFSPDGRIYQVEYAREAVKRGAPSVGIRTSDGVVLAAQSRTASTLMESESVEKLHKLDEHLGVASAGHVADARKLIDFARRKAQTNRLRYGEPIDVETIAKAVTDSIQESTQSGGTRPFGASLLLGGVEDETPRLFSTDPSGTPHEWRATVIGGSRGDIQAFLEDEYREDLTVDDGITLAVRALLVADDELRADELSLAVVTLEDGYRPLDAEDVEAVLGDLGDEGE
ncbi:MAG: archaeal proteasome endopeptidase complex subunit alpha [Halobacteriota archaeon]